MKVIIEKESGAVLSVISKSAVKQAINEGETEIEVIDPEIIDAFNRGEEILYSKSKGKVYYQAKVEIDPEKAVLYEAVASLFEEVEMLKAQLGGDK